MRGWRGLRICWCRLRRRLWGRLCRGRLRLEEEEKDRLSHLICLLACLLACLLLQVKRQTSLIQAPFLSLRRKKRNAFTPRGYHIATKCGRKEKREERKKKFQVAKLLLLLPASPWILSSPSSHLKKAADLLKAPQGLTSKRKKTPPPWILGP